MNPRLEHLDQIERWAEFIRNNPHKWKKIHTEFINAIFDKHEQFKKRLLAQPNGKEKWDKLYNKNKPY